MKSKIVFCLALAYFFECNILSAQSFHLFLFCDTFDSALTKPARLNYVNIREHFQEVAHVLNINFIEHSITGSHFNANAIKNTTKNAKIDDHDIVVLYFNSHGILFQGDSFPTLLVRDEVISSKEIHKAFETKNPRFLLSLVEACSEFREATPQESFLMFENQGLLVLQNKRLKSKLQIENSDPINLRRLFEVRCNLLTTAGEPGKITWGFTSDGSVFTNCFIRTMNELTMATKNGRTVTWEHILSQTKQYTFDITNDYSPIWKSEACDNNDTIEPKTFASDDFVIKSSWKHRKFWVKNPFRVHLEIINRSKLKIDSVVYLFHKSMPKPSLTKYNASEDFLTELFVYAEFPIKAKVFLSNNRVVELYTELNFRKDIRNFNR